METGAASLAGKEGPSLSVRRRTVPLVTVIVINYNGRPFLDELLQTLGSFETLLIDNASSDGSLPYLRERFPWVQLLPQPVNLGFSRAANRGADRSTAPYLAFLNPDVKLEPSWLEELVAVAKSNRQVAAVASKMRFYDRPDILNGVGGSMNYLGYTWDRGMNECDRGQYDTVQEVLFASAGAALFRRDIFREEGGFDEKFFMYHEDVDLCWRLWIRGLRVLTAPRALAYHHWAGSTRQAGGLVWREIIGERNNMRTLIKNYEFRNLARSLLDLWLLPQPWRRKWAQGRNSIWNLRHLPDTLGQRNRVQSRRRRSDASLKHLIVQSRHVLVRV